ncbi:hypothetical protein [Candidatus Oscillochloris fontis]|uniref:hypothetical protein n=1 Tax=Candidatus Oscillochloris fontis TaxID=2496868 RepID=UPI00101CCEA8|nr:hypothetical protein [Candidatus Oscillochloris fontis]
MAYSRWFVLLLVLLLSACGTPSALEPSDPRLATLPTDLTEEAVVIPPAPADPALLVAWANPQERWRAVAEQAARLDGASPESIEAENAALEAAWQTGLALATQARTQGYEVDDSALIAEIAWRMIAHNHPLRADPAREAADTAAWVEVWQGRSTGPAVVTGRLLANAMVR